MPLAGGTSPVLAVPLLVFAVSVVPPELLLLLPDGIVVTTSAV